MYKIHSGGEIIGSGGSGCVFKPALICKNSKRRTNGISKLLLNTEANMEWNKIKLVKKYIERIPNNQEYFLLSLEKCHPARLSDKDKVNFYRCSILNNYGITKSNINDNLNKVQMINMPYGGNSLNQVLDMVVKNKISYILINNLLINLLLNGIIPMNKLNLYHFDIKGENLLYNNKYVKIIDFGEAGVSTTKQIIPTNLFRRRIQFNSPFSRILFSEIFDLALNEHLTKYKINESSNRLNLEIKKFMKKYYKFWKERVGEGHEGYLSSYVLPAFFQIANRPEPKNLLEELVCNYCTKILIKYINFSTKTFDKEAYFKQVYSKNVDIYGFIMTYLSLLFPVSPKSPTEIKNKKFDKKRLANIIIKYCFSTMYADIPININELVKELKESNEFSTRVAEVNLDKLDYSLKKQTKRTKTKRTKTKRTKTKRTKIE